MLDRTQISVNNTYVYVGIVVLWTYLFFTLEHFLFVYGSDSVLRDHFWHCMLYHVGHG